MSFSFRKRAKVTEVDSDLNYKDGLIVNLNGKGLPYYFDSCLVTPSLKKLMDSVTGVFNIKIRGGGISSQFQLIEKVLFASIKLQNLKKEIKKTYPYIDRTDQRINYAKLYGGRKARARSQKSYR